MRIVYYVELNIACIIILLVIRSRSRREMTQLSAAGISFDQMLWATIALCLFDLIAGVSRGQFFPGARVVIELSNLLYLEAFVVIGYLWTLYVDCTLHGRTRNSLRWHRLYAIPLILFTVAAATNPLTHFMFTVDANNLYARNTGVYFHWVVTWTYMLYPIVLIVRALLREKNKLKRQEIAPLMYFVVAPAAASAAQMLFYGVTSSQLGITISLLVLCLSVQGNQILTDALTGLNNRRGLLKYLQDHIARQEGQALAIIMIDIDHFKQINDQYGHMTGDMALKEIAAALKQACRTLDNRPFLCRYGGDEFVVAGIGSKEDLNAFTSALHAELAARKSAQIPHPLTVSIGTATGECHRMEEAERLIQAADKAMYVDKKRMEST